MMMMQIMLKTPTMNDAGNDDDDCDDDDENVDNDDDDNDSDLQWGVATAA